MSVILSLLFAVLSAAHCCAYFVRSLAVSALSTTLLFTAAYFMCVVTWLHLIAEQFRLVPKSLPISSVTSLPPPLLSSPHAQLFAQQTERTRSPVKTTQNAHHGQSSDGGASFAPVVLPCLVSYLPSPLLPSPTHTLLGNVARYAPRQLIKPFSSELVRLPDGGAIAVDWFGRSKDFSTVLLIVPGTKGVSSVSYVQAAIEKAMSMQWTVVVAALRGCGVDKLETAECFDGASHTDIAHVLTSIRAHIREDACNRVSGAPVPVVALGYSMGGGMLAHCLAFNDETRQKHGVVAAVAISATADYTAAMDHMHTSWESRVYNLLLTQISKVSLWRHRASFAPKYAISMRKAMLTTSIREWHAEVTCKLRRFDSSAAFCEHVSFAPLLSHLSTPLLFISARNDPICPHWTIPVHLTASNPHLWVVQTRSGGHTGFPSGLLPWKNLSWDTDTALQWLQAGLQAGKT
jgi:abhydrolase domain-containing protein 1/3